MTEDSTHDAQEDTADEAVRQSKVQRVIEEYELGDLGADLASRWQGAKGERTSLRDLAEYFNRRVLRAELESHGMNPLEGETENFYRLLTDESVGRGSHVEAVRRLERGGLDVDALTDDFVSHQAIHTYLTKYREVEAPSGSDGDRIENSHESIQRMQNRTRSVVENTLASLRNADHLTLPEFRVFVDVRIMCGECGTQHDVGQLLATGGCECQQ